MSAKISDFAAAKEKREPHVTGEAKCMACRHEWVAVVPYGTEEPLECPKCGTSKGKFKFPYSPPKGSAIWVCNCGNDLFFKLSSGHLMCPNCGEYHEE
jgi:predicted RNA-binding Zn-ribbon protein involved in translation (DUF1610 family)